MLGTILQAPVEATGAGVSRFEPGQRVFGLLGTAAAAHMPRTSSCHTRSSRRRPEEAGLQSLAVLPYSFTTMWLAVRATGLAAANAASARADQRRFRRAGPARRSDA